jgi:hypothetical protein
MLTFVCTVFVFIMGPACLLIVNLSSVTLINKRECERLGIPIINLNVRILCLRNDVAPTHRLPACPARQAPMTRP